EEAVLRVDSVKSSVLARLEPSDIIADSPNLVALLGVNLRGNEHSQVGLSARRGECRAYILDLAVGLLYSEDEHVLSHPALILALIRGDSESEALLAEKNISAVCGVYGPDSVVLGELNDVSVLGVNICLGVKSSYKVVGGVSEVLKRLLAH